MVDLVYFFIEEGVYKRSKIDNGGNQFNFDRRGNIGSNSAGDAESKFKVRNETLINTVKSIKLKILRLQ